MTNEYDESFVPYNEIDAPERVEEKHKVFLYKLYIDSLLSDNYSRMCSNKITE